jgi:hypothetical protein
MPLPSPGVALSLNDIKNEFGGPSSPISLADYYRGGLYVPSTLPDGTSINSNIPTSGTITISNFYNGAGAFVFNQTISSSANNYNLNTALTNAGWNGTSAVQVNVTINNGVYVYSNSYDGSTPAFYVGTLPSHSAVSITNNGVIAGCGGSVTTASNGGNGSPGMEIHYPVTITNNNNAYITGGGGGGGAGGGGYFDNTVYTGHNGGNGAAAIVQYANITVINNSGATIGGGGGGGAGGGSFQFDSATYSGGGGGGGGAGGCPLAPAYSAGYGSVVHYTIWVKLNGYPLIGSVAGVITNGGGGLPWAYVDNRPGVYFYSYGGFGGVGGNLGAAGAAAAAGFGGGSPDGYYGTNLPLTAYSGGEVGQAGAAIVHNSYIATVTNNGTISGTY